MELEEKDGVFWLKWTVNEHTEPNFSLLQNLENKPNFQSGIRVVLEVVECDPKENSTRIRSWARNIAQWGRAKHIELAILVHDETSFGFARMFETWVENDLKVSIFKQEKQLHDWLGAR